MPVSQHAQNQALRWEVAIFINYSCVWPALRSEKVSLVSVKAKLCLLGSVEHCVTAATSGFFKLANFRSQVLFLLTDLCAHPFGTSSILSLVNIEWDSCWLSRLHAVYILCLLLACPGGGIQPLTSIISDVARSFLLLMYEWPFRKSIWNHKGFVYTPSDAVWIIHN